MNRKYKLIFTAVDRRGRVLGVAGATPKKGEPIKLMPFVATEGPAFFALLADVPNLLSEYGRKVYVHLTPTSEQTRYLQQSGWTLDGLMPDAYQPKTVTQQWSLEIGKDRFMRTIRLKLRYLEYMREGKKSLEVRVRYDTLKTLKVGEEIEFVSRTKKLKRKIKDIRTYPSFDLMLGAEDYRKIVPDMRKEQVAGLLKEIYPPAKEKLGVMVIELAEPN